MNMVQISLSTRDNDAYLEADFQIKTKDTIKHKTKTSQYVADTGVFYQVAN